MMDQDELLVDGYFAKDDLKKIIEDVRAILTEFKITAQLWVVSHNGISFHLMSAVEDITTAIWQIYTSKDIFYQVAQSIEPNTRVRLLHVILKPNWYVPKEALKG